MNIDAVVKWATGVVLSFAAMGQIDALQAAIWRAQAQVLYESRSSAWGSPRFFPSEATHSRLTQNNHCYQSKHRRAIPSAESTNGGAICNRQ